MPVKQLSGAAGQGSCGITVQASAGHLMELLKGAHHPQSRFGSGTVTGLCPQLCPAQGPVLAFRARCCARVQ